MKVARKLETPKTRVEGTVEGREQKGERRQNFCDMPGEQATYQPEKGRPIPTPSHPRTEKAVVRREDNKAMVRERVATFQV